MKSTRRLALPLGANPYAKEVGRRLRLVRVKRGLTEPQAAKQLGVSAVEWGIYASGLGLPQSELAKRLVKWMFEGVTYEKQPLLSRTALMKRDGWQRYDVHLPPNTVQRLRRRATLLNVTSDELLQIGIERLLDNEPVLNTLDKAIEQVRRANVVQLLAENPELACILQGDMALALEVTTAREAPQEPTAVEAIVSKPFEEDEEKEVGE